MKHNLNSINGRVAEAEMAERRKFLGDRWHPRALDDREEMIDLPSPICSNAP